MYEIRKIFYFEMAHILSKSYSKECQKFHGHSYKLEVIIKSEVLDKNGVVMDFKKLKEIVQPIVNKLDHICLVESTVTVDRSLKEQMIRNGIYFVDYNPTAENMVKYFYDEISSYIRDFDIQINLWETKTGMVSYYKK